MTYRLSLGRIWRRKLPLLQKMPPTCPPSVGKETSSLFASSFRRFSTLSSLAFIMSDKLQEFLQVPQEFVRDGNQVCLYRPPNPLPLTPFRSSWHGAPSRHERVSFTNAFLKAHSSQSTPEFLQISYAVAVGFAVMGFIGYFVKLIHIPMCVTRTLILTCSLITHSLSQKQHPCVRPVPNPMQYSCLPKPPAAAHDHPPSFHLYSLPLLYNAIAIPL